MSGVLRRLSVPPQQAHSCWDAHTTHTSTRADARTHMPGHGRCGAGGVEPPLLCHSQGVPIPLTPRASSALLSLPDGAERFPKHRREKKKKKSLSSMLAVICKAQRKKYAAQQGPCCILYGISAQPGRPICLSVYKL